MTTPPLVDQPSAAPTRKVKATVVGGGIGFILAFMIVALWNRFMPDSQLDAETTMTLGSFLSTAIGFLSAYLTRNRAIPCDPVEPAIQVGKPASPEKPA